MLSKQRFSIFLFALAAFWGCQPSSNEDISVNNKKEYPYRIIDSTLIRRFEMATGIRGRDAYPLCGDECSPYKYYCVGEMSDLDVAIFRRKSNWEFDDHVLFWDKKSDKIFYWLNTATDDEYWMPITDNKYWVRVITDKYPWVKNYRNSYDSKGLQLFLDNLTAFKTRRTRLIKPNKKISPSELISEQEIASLIIGSSFDPITVHSVFQDRYWRIRTQQELDRKYENTEGHIFEFVKKRTAYYLTQPFTYIYFCNSRFFVISWVEKEQKFKVIDYSRIFRRPDQEM